MKKNVLALSIAAMIGGLGFAGAASAGVIKGTGVLNAASVWTDGKMNTPNVTGFKLAEGGTGHALVVPYYNAQNGNMTVVHLVNTDSKNGKVVKVRFRGASNSDDVLDFQLLMSPGDVWTGAVVQGANGFANLVSTDNTCSIPSIKTAGGVVPFSDIRLNPALSAAAAANQTREGYVEIFNSADIPGDKIYGKDGDANSALYLTTKHSSGVAACDSTTINAALFNADYSAEGNGTGQALAITKLGLNSPTGGLSGDWYIMNVPQTTTFAGTTTALVATAPAQPAVGNFVAFPQNASIAVATPELLSADPLLASAGASFLKKTAVGVTTEPTTVAPIVANAQDFPDLSTPYVTAAAAPAAGEAANQAAALTQALAVSAVSNQYAKDASITAKTDWVFSMPTRRYSVAVDYNAKNAVNQTEPARVFTVVDGTVAGLASAPAKAQYFSSDNTTMVGDQVCVGTGGAKFLDREESTKTGVPTFSPSKSSSPRLCGEVSVLSFGEGAAAPSVLAASVAREDVAAAAIFENGWGTVSAPNYPKTATVAQQPTSSIGLPILGYSVIKLTNPSASAGMSGTYGITWPHRFVKVNP